MSVTYEQIQIIKDHLLNMGNLQISKVKHKEALVIRKEILLCCQWLKQHDTDETRVRFELEHHAEEARLVNVLNFINDNR